MHSGYIAHLLANIFVVSPFKYVRLAGQRQAQCVGQAGVLSLCVSQRLPFLVSKLLECPWHSEAITSTEMLYDDFQKMVSLNALQTTNSPLACHRYHRV